MNGDSDGPPIAMDLNEVENAEQQSPHEPQPKKRRLTGGIETMPKIQLKTLISGRRNAGRDVVEAANDIAELLNLDYIVGKSFFSWFREVMHKRISEDIVHSSIYYQLLQRVRNDYATFDILHDDPLGSSIIFIRIPTENEGSASTLLNTDRQNRICCYASGAQGDEYKPFTLIDTVHGTTTSGVVTIDSDPDDYGPNMRSEYTQLEFISSTRILAFDFAQAVGYGYVHLLDFNSATFQCSVLDKRRFDDAKFALVNDQDLNRFAINTFGEGFFFGEIVDNRIVLGESVRTFEGYSIIRYSGNKLYGFKLKPEINDEYDDEEEEERHVNPEKLFIYDINTRVFDQIPLTTSFAPYLLERSLHPSGSAWLKIPCTVYDDKLFIAPQTNHKFSIYVIDLKNGKFTETGIKGVGRLTDLSIDMHGILTLPVDCFFRNWQNPRYTIHRIALRKPDTLRNIAWFSIRRQSIFGRGELYEQVKERLPYNSDLRLSTIEYLESFC